MAQPLLAACMGCGERLAVDAQEALADTRGWKYDFDLGWLCQRCDGLDARLQQRRRRGPGMPMKGHGNDDR